MSAEEDVLTEDDHALLDHLEQDSEEQAEAHIRDLREEVRRLRAKFRKHERRTEKRLQALEDQRSVDDSEDQTLLEIYCQITPEDRDGELSTSESVAVTIHEQWADTAWTLGGGSNYAGESNDQRVGVDTKTRANAKYNPSRLKHRLKKELGWDPAANQVYRGLKKLAQISGGEEIVDEHTDRVQVMGGLYEYREMATADGTDTKRVLWRADQ